MTTVPLWRHRIREVRENGDRIEADLAERVAEVRPKIAHLAVVTSRAERAAVQFLEQQDTYLDAAVDHNRR